MDTYKYKRVFYSPLLNLPSSRFYCVGGCWDRTQDWCNFVSGAVRRHNPQSRRSARLLLQSSELGHPHSLTCMRVLPPLWFPGGTHLLAGEGVGGLSSDEGTDTVVLYKGVVQSLYEGKHKAGLEHKHGLLSCCHFVLYSCFVFYLETPSRKRSFFKIASFLIFDASTQTCRGGGWGRGSTVFCKSLGQLVNPRVGGGTGT